MQHTMPQVMYHIESEAAATIVDPSSHCHPGSGCTDPHPPGCRAFINHMDKLSGKPDDNDFTVLVLSQ